MNFGSILTKLLKAAKLCGPPQQCKRPFQARPAGSTMPGAAGRASSPGDGTGGVARWQWRVAEMAWDRVPIGGNSRAVA